MQFPSRDKVSFALDGWKSTNNLAMSLGIVYYMDQIWALHEVQPAFDEVDRLFISYLDSELRMIGHGPIYWSNASRRFKGCA
jgi:hypothetical protein